MLMNYNSLLSKSLHPRIIVYTPSGNGRDSYILSNNGGFCKEYVMPKIKEKFLQPSTVRKYDLSLKDRPINRYYANGNGRDLYVVRENPSNRDNRMAQLDLPSILRNDKFSTPSLKVKDSHPLKPEHAKHLNLLRSVQNSVLDRLFYGKGDSSERSMSPKVKFIKKQILKIKRNSTTDLRSKSNQRMKISFSFTPSSDSILKEHLSVIFKNRVNQDFIS